MTWNSLELPLHKQVFRIFYFGFEMETTTTHFFPPWQLQLGIDESYSLYVVKDNGRSIVGQATIEVGWNLIISILSKPSKTNTSNGDLGAVLLLREQGGIWKRGV